MLLLLLLLQLLCTTLLNKPGEHIRIDLAHLVKAMLRSLREAAAECRLAQALPKATMSRQCNRPTDNPGLGRHLL